MPCRPFVVRNFLALVSISASAVLAGGCVDCGPNQPVSFSPVGVPDSVAEAELTTLSETELRVDWLPPASIKPEGSNGAPVSGYVVEIATDAQEVQRVSMSADSGPLGGSFRLGLGGHETSCIEIGSPADTVELYLEELPSVDGVHVTLLNESETSLSYEIRFDGPLLSSGNQDTLEFDPSDCSVLSPAAMSYSVISIQEGVAPFIPHVVSISTGAPSDAFVGGHMILSMNHQGNYQQFVVTGAGDVAQFKVEAGSKIVDTMGVDLSSVLLKGDILELMGETGTIDRVLSDSLVLSTYHEGGTGGAAVSAKRLENYVGIGQIPSNGNTLIEINGKPLDTVIGSGDTIQMHDDEGVAIYFEVTSVSGSTASLATTYDGTTSLTSAVVAKRRAVASAHATSQEMKNAIESLPGVGSVEVRREGPSSDLGYTWYVTFTSNTETSDCLSESGCFVAEKSVLSCLDLSNVGAQYDGQFVVTKFEDGRPVYTRLGTALAIVYDQANARWTLFDDSSSTVLAEVASVLPEVPLLGWSAGATLTPRTTPAVTLTGTNADVTVTEHQQGSSGPFAGNVVFSSNVTEHHPEVQIIHLSAESDDMHGFFALSYQDESQTITVESSTSADDLKALLESLPHMGELDVTRNANGHGYDWSVTFLTNTGDVEMIKHHGTSNLHGSSFGLDITEQAKGEDIRRYVVAPNLVQGRAYTARVAAFNRAGTSKFTTADQKRGRGVIPITRTAASVPEAPSITVLMLSNSQLDVRFTSPAPNGDAIDMYLVEWTTSDNFGTHERIKIDHSCDVERDMIGTFRLVFGAGESSERTVPISVQASDDELAAALINLRSIWNVTVTTLRQDGLASQWEVEFDQNTGNIGSFSLESAVTSESGDGSVTSLVTTLAHGTLPENYGSDYLYSDAAFCGSILMGGSSSTQYVSLAAEFDSAAISGGTYRLALGNQVTACISYDASAAAMEAALLGLGNIHGVNVVRLLSPSVSQFPYSYKIMFLGEFEYGDWPVLRIPEDAFGTGSCSAFTGGTNHRAIALPMRDEVSCSNGRKKTQSIIADSSSSLGGTFDIHYGGNVVTSVSLGATAAQMERYLWSLGGFESVKVTKAFYQDNAFGTAWIVRFMPTNETLEMFAVDDKLTTGSDAAVSSYPVLNITSSATQDDISGDFRIYLGGETTNVISHRATHGKILHELHKLVGVGKAVMLGSQYEDDESGIEFRALIDDSLIHSSLKAFSVAGDVTGSIAKGDTVVLGGCNLVLEMATYSQFDATQGAGLLYETKYPLTPSTKSARLRGYTTIQVRQADGASALSSFVTDCSQGDEVSAPVKVGTYIKSKRALPGRVSLVSGDLVLTATYGSPYVTFSAGFATSPGDKVTIKGMFYEVAASNDGCGADCVKFTSNFAGATVTDPVKAFRQTGMFAATTSDLSTVLFASDSVYIGLDKLSVQSVSPSGLVVSGKVSGDSVGATIYAVGYGVEHAMIMKAYTADLGTFRVVPESNWRGTGSRIFTERPNGMYPLRYVLGNAPELQLVTMRDTSPGPGNSFVLSLDGFTTSVMVWPVGDGVVAANEIKSQLLSLHSVKGEISVEVSSFTEYDFVFFVKFFGIYSQGSIPELTSSIVSQGDDHASVSHRTMHNGIALGDFTSQYNALQAADGSGSVGQYAVRVSARNSEGFGPPSDVVMASTAEIGLLPGPPQAVFLGKYTQLESLDLLFQPPAHDGGSAIQKYKVEWDSSPAFHESSSHYGSSEIAKRHETQDIVLSCRSECFGTFTLAWGGRVSGSLGVEATATEMEAAISTLVGVDNMGANPIRVSRRAVGSGNAWTVTFWGVDGNLGELEADGHFLYGGDPHIVVNEIVGGSADIYPGAYTYEVQTIYIIKERGFNAPTTGSFTLAFEDKETSAIDVSASAEEMKAALEELDSIHTVNVEREVIDGRSLWRTTLTHLLDQNRQGAGDIGMIRVASSQISDPTVTHVRVFENVKGTNEFHYKFGEACLEC